MSEEIRHVKEQKHGTNSNHDPERTNSLFLPLLHGWTCPNHQKKRGFAACFAFIVHRLAGVGLM